MLAYPMAALAIQRAASYEMTAEATGKYPQYLQVTARMEKN